MSNTRIKPLMMGGLEVKLPIIQGGMGVRVSTAPLAAAVANCGAAGTIASVGLSPDTEENRADVPKASREHLQKQLKEARLLSDGVIGVNIMVALSNYEDISRTAASEGADFIISGAGLPISLPEFTEGTSTRLIPLIASSRGLNVVLKTWSRRYKRLPDAVILEGPLSGGHIAGYSLSQLNALGHQMNREPLLERALKEVLGLVAEYENKYSVSIPVIVAGGVFDGKDMAKFLGLGAAGVQIGTRFVATEECSVSGRFKELYVRSTAEDLVFVQSPVGMPARAIRTKLLDDIFRGEKKPFDCNYQCLRTCDPSSVQFCIAKALINAVDGDIDNAVVLAGSNIDKVKEILPVRDIIETIISEAREILENETPPAIKG